MQYATETILVQLVCTSLQPYHQFRREKKSRLKKTLHIKQRASIIIKLNAYFALYSLYYYYFIVYVLTGAAIVYAVLLQLHTLRSRQTTIL
jgi:hypothetical protein